MGTRSADLELGNHLSFCITTAEKKKKKLVTDADGFWQTATQRFLGISNFTGSDQHHIASYPLSEFTVKHAYCKR